MLEQVKETIYDQPERTKHSMSNFVYTVGLTYIPISEKSLAVAEEIGELVIECEHKKPQTLNAYASIQKEIERDRIGFKRKYVRC